MRLALKVLKRKGLLWTCGVYAFGGCVTDAQLSDFVRTEFARVTADTVGQIFLLAVRSILGIQPV